MERNERIQYLRAMACFAVILVHMYFGGISIYGGTISKGLSVFSWCITYNMKWAVPCFLMVTGALLLQPERQVTLKKLWSKYIFKVALALLICCVVFNIFDMIMNRTGFSFAGVMKGFSNFVLGKSWSHLWYLYLMIGIYVLLPFFKKITASSTKQELGYLLIVCIIFISIFPAITKIGYNIAFYLSITTIYPVYLFLGYYIYRFKPVGVRLAWILLILSTAALVGLNILCYGFEISWLNAFNDHPSIFVIIQAGSIFSLFTSKNGEIKCRPVRAAILSIDECSFGIYLFHMMFGRIALRYMGINPYSHWFTMPLIIICIFIVTYILVRLLHLIPGVKKVF